MTLTSGQSVFHPRHGSGVIRFVEDDTAAVRFAHGLEEVEVGTLEVRTDPLAALAAGTLARSLDALVKAQALAILSCNDQWGVYSRSRIALLPHQLWVCRQVTQTTPFRWLIADDVGLGKTIEAGLVMMPLLASGKVRRLLILAPAKLVPQWRQRLKDMFDIRLHAYAETDGSGAFWDAADRVVGSIHTLRGEERRKALLKAEPWDLVIVDEAHHLGVDDNGAMTLAYDLLRELEERRRIGSLLFFTGTPHKGKDYAFFALMQLVNPDLFDPKGDLDAQYANLPQAMIRNNKAVVTDLDGNKLFTSVRVHNETFDYSAEEAAFYETMSAFITTGYAYAGTFNARGASSRQLVLTTLQKLAASSVAAIRSALTRRRATLAHEVAAADVAIPEGATEEEVTDAEERNAGSSGLELMKGEIEKIDELLALAAAVGRETKIDRIVDLIADRLPGEPVLLFTEYKATQAAVINALHERFGAGTATFINGDDELRGVKRADGTFGTMTATREGASAAFNGGTKRFLVSTEAGGEGIDLQERCANLIHADLPWNPMRMHQRVGRLSRYGQKRPVDVFLLRNPQTVEARITELLDEKLERIQSAFSTVMEDQEDIRQLVVGMVGDGFFSELYAQGGQQQRRGLRDWFDAKASRLDGEDIVRTVQRMFGSVRRFDFGANRAELPRSDLADLEPFVRAALGRHRRQLQRDKEDGSRFEVIVPDEWQDRDFALGGRYDGLTFDRNFRGQDAATKVLGVGHPLFDAALADAATVDAAVATLQGLARPIAVVVVADLVTDTGGNVRQVVFGVPLGDDAGSMLRDWELVQLLGACGRGEAGAPVTLPTATTMEAAVDAVTDRLTDLAPTMRRPSARCAIVLLPGAA